MKNLIKIFIVLILFSLFLKCVFQITVFPLFGLLNSCDDENSRKYDKPVIEKQVANLSGRWKFNLGDDLKWKEENFNDSKWEKVFVPSAWENQGFHGYDGYAWYRTSFTVNEKDSDKNLYLVLGYIDDVDQTYLNGKLIGVSGVFPQNSAANGKILGVSDGFPNTYRTAYNAFRKYFIPKEYLNKDKENVIAVRIYDDELDGGIISGNIGIYYYEGGIEPDVNLTGIWNFTTKDSLMLNSSYADSEFDNLMVPANWDVQGYEDYDGFGWYRKKFFLPGKFSGKDMILLAGKIDDIDQTFVNGVMVGSTGKWNFKNIPDEFDANEEYRMDRVYSVPKKILKFNDYNTIVVRVYDGFKNGGIYEGPVGLLTQKNYKKIFGKN